MEAIAAEQKAAQVLAGAEFRRIKGEMDAARNTAREKLEAIDAEKKALQKLASEQLDALRERDRVAREHATTRLREIDAQMEAARALTLDTDNLRDIAKRLGIDESNLGEGFNRQAAAEQQERLALDLSALTGAGANAETLFRSSPQLTMELAKAVQRAVANNLTIDERLRPFIEAARGAGDSLGLADDAVLKFGTGLTDEMSEQRATLADLKQQREAVEAALNTALETIAAEREAIEDQLHTDLERLAGEREAVETTLRETIERLEGERDTVETTLRTTLERLAGERETAETTYRTTIERLEGERDAAETVFNAEITRLEGERDAIETEFNTTLEGLNARRAEIEGQMNAYADEQRELRWAGLEEERSQLQSAFSIGDGLGSAATNIQNKADEIGGINIPVPTVTPYDPWANFDPLSGLNVPFLADGGVVRRPTLAMVGEGGPEAVTPLGGGGGLVSEFKQALREVLREEGGAAGGDVLIDHRGVRVIGEIAVEKLAESGHRIGVKTGQV